MADKLTTPNPNMQWFDNDGNMLAGGRLYTYVAGGTTPQATYTSQDGSSANTNPVVLDSAGRANVWMTPGVSYRFDMYTSAGVLLWTVDDIPGGSLAGQSSVTANFVYAGPTTGAAAAPDFRALVAADIPSVSATYALVTLANLGTTNINAALLAQTGIDLGSAAAAFRFLFLWGTGTFGTTSIKLTGVPTGARVVTLPDATDTLVGKATTDTLTNKTYDTAGTGNSFLINGLAATANTGTGSVVRATSPTIVTPTIADLTNIQHTHQTVAQGGLLPPSKYPINIISGDGAINPNTSACYVITKGSAAALTLAAPTATTDDGVQIVVTSASDFAHVITATNLLETGAVTDDVATFAIFAGASLTLMAYQAKWYVISQNAVVFT